MLGALRELWELGTAEAKREAAAIAKDAAPYIHPRLASIDQTINESYQCVIRAPEPLTNEDWEAKYGRANIGADDCLSTDIGSRTLLPKPRAEDV